MRKLIGVISLILFGVRTLPPTAWAYTICVQAFQSPIHSELPQGQRCSGTPLSAILGQFSKVVTNAAPEIQALMNSPALYLKTSVAAAANSTTLTFPDISGVLVGATVSIDGITGANGTIVNSVNGNGVTLNQPISDSVPANTWVGFNSGKVSFYTTGPTYCCSNILHLQNTTDLSVGETVTGIEIAPLTVIASIQGNTVILSRNVLANVAGWTTISFGAASPPTTKQTNYNTLAGANILTLSSVTGISVGQLVSGANIPSGTSVISIATPPGPSPTVTLSQNLTGTDQSNTLVTFQNKEVRVFIIGPSSTAAVDTNESMGWSAWSADYKTLYIGLSQLAFSDDSSSLSVSQLETAKLLQLLWAPGGGTTVDLTTMPHFAPAVLDSSAVMSDGDLAVYDLLAHEIAHYWNTASGIYTQSNSGLSSGCGPNAPSPCYPLVGGSFPTFSWSGYEADKTVFNPPWEPSGIWDYSTNSVTTGAQTLFSNAFSTAKPHGIQTWPDNTVSNQAMTLYSSFPSFLAAASPEEDIAETYTLLALYQAGVDSICLVVPTTDGNNISDQGVDVINKLVGTQTSSNTLWQKVQWVQANANLFGASSISIRQYVPPSPAECPPTSP